MTDERFKGYIKNRQYLSELGHSSCYLPNHDGSCGYNSNFTSIWLPVCDGCLARFRNGEGVPVPDELKELPGCNKDRQFSIWKAFQIFEAFHVTGYYTDEQLKKVREEYIKFEHPDTCPVVTTQTPEKLNKKILSALFGG